jgi:hypothetical protein
MATFFAWLGSIILGVISLWGLLMAFARIGPDEAASNLSKWARKAHLHQVPEWLSRKEMDAFVLLWGKRAIILLAPIGIFLFIIWYMFSEPRGYVGRPLGIRWPSARLLEVNEGTVRAFVLDAYNSGSDQLIIRDAYILSDVDGTRIRMEISTPPGSWIPIAEAGPIPTDAYIAFSASFGASFSEAEFIQKWHNFDVIVEFDQTQVRHSFDSKWVFQHINENHPESKPHVSRRQP